MVEIYFVLAYGSKWTWFSCRGIETDLILKRGRKLAWFRCWGRNDIGFLWRIEVDLVLVGRSKLTWLLHEGSNFTLFLCAGRKRFVFLVNGSKLARFYGGDGKRHGLCVPAEIRLVCSVGVD